MEWEHQRTLIAGLLFQNETRTGRTREDLDLD